MTTEAILETVANAARSRHTVSVSLRTNDGSAQAEVEPYSVARRHLEPTLFYWDLEKGRIVGVPLTALMGATPTNKAFTPRYEIEF